MNTPFYYDDLPPIRKEARIRRKTGYWDHLRRKPLDTWTAEECAEMFMRYIGWAGEELLALSDRELLDMWTILNEDPRGLSPYDMHWRYEYAESVSLTVAEIVRAHDAQRLGERE